MPDNLPDWRSGNLLDDLAVVEQALRSHLFAPKMADVVLLAIEELKKQPLTGNS